MNDIDALAARRRLLAASATLQRVRLVHEWDRLWQVSGPSRWAAAALAGAALAAAGAALAASRHQPATAGHATWVTRAVLVWRLVRALRR